MDPYSYEENRQRVSRLSRSFGIGALAFAAIFNSVPFLGFGFACMSVLFALLSRGTTRKLDKNAKFGLGAAIIAIVICVSVTCYSVFTFVYNDDYRTELLTQMDELYGDYYTEAYGETPSEMMESILEGIR